MLAQCIYPFPVRKYPLLRTGLLNPHAGSELLTQLKDEFSGQLALMGFFAGVADQIAFCLRQSNHIW